MASHCMNNIVAHFLLAIVVVILCISDASVAHNFDHNAIKLNAIDGCWRLRGQWWKHKQRLARCSIGFAGKMTNNVGKDLVHYKVTDPSDDPTDPKPGTLRFGASVIKGKATDIIIHGLNIHHCQPQQGGKVASPEGLVNVNKADADAIRLISASNIWIDHNTLSECHDGLIDVTRGSTNITISNNWFTNQNKVMLLGHDDGYIRDKDMKVTIVYNHFGPNCNQRMPRIRHGYAHVANNLYNRWLSYAIGGSMDPRVKSESNFFIALETGKKEITWREGGDENSWNMYSVSDHFVNGASFKGTGHGGAKPHYTKTQRFKVKDAKFVQAVTKSAGALHCAKHFPC